MRASTAQIGHRTALGIGLAACLAVLLCTARALAAPLDLSDETPRWVEVRFEVSPPDQPGRLDSVWSAARRAYLEPDPERALVRIRVPASEVEAHLRSTGTDAVPGSFSEFVWVLDPGSGEVLEAVLSGRVRERVRLGFLRTSATIDISVEMTTRGTAGFASESNLLGIETQRFCRPDRADPGRACVAVAAARFDPERGYVNAVGSVRAATPILEIKAFSPLGEVRFSEAMSPPAQALGESGSVASGVSRADAVCSAGFDDGCPAGDLGGES